MQSVAYYLHFRQLKNRQKGIKITNAAKEVAEMESGRKKGHKAIPKILMKSSIFNLLDLDYSMMKNQGNLITADAQSNEQQPLSLLRRPRSSRIRKEILSWCRHFIHSYMPTLRDFLKIESDTRQLKIDK